ncbi:MAG: tRNA (5-methylaminomethyl-2-thiouridine)(34)-methyltransferase MnmD [Bacteroidales bacterium]|nr:tRNA (5-methylaminomethyl-2-thiouridine)(34)-methyltransferase MnmD [Bacteroidales bacterium]MCF8334207.1 tRNA (5-methylaminomethyl-2-thiouridine)(34)-methyltransferase MnmD [Bacteroidales bacterium]
MERKLITTSDSSHTIYLPEMEEYYHSTNGAIQESRHVFIRKGYHFIDEAIDNVNILEVGFGTGLNALLTLLESEKTGRRVNYVAVEPYPLEKDLYQKLNYGELLNYEKAGSYLQQMHETKWNFPYYIGEDFILNKLSYKLEDTDLKPSVFHLVYYDAFAPGKQEEMWNKDLFKKCYEALQEGGVLVTYSSKGQVRRDLAEAGFTVSRIEGAAGKREMLRAIK